MKHIISALFFIAGLPALTQGMTADVIDEKGGKAAFFPYATVQLNWTSNHPQVDSERFLVHVYLQSEEPPLINQRIQIRRYSNDRVDLEIWRRKGSYTPARISLTTACDERTINIPEPYDASLAMEWLYKNRDMFFHGLSDLIFKKAGPALQKFSAKSSQAGSASGGDPSYNTQLVMTTHFLFKALLNNDADTLDLFFKEWDSFHESFNQYYYSGP
ncbi:MAG: hypothetical protein QNK37_32330 [Acidobacteriota bacterium]|nr:hypothetical protein [Acidobacteriota bacterium]